MNRYTVVLENVDDNGPGRFPVARVLAWNPDNAVSTAIEKTADPATKYRVVCVLDGHVSPLTHSFNHPVTVSKS